MSFCIAAKIKKHKKTTDPAVVAEWAKASVLIQVERHQRSQVQILLEVGFIRLKISRAYFITVVYS